MKIYIDLNHPAHIHYFRNFIKIMEGKGHTFVISCQDSQIIKQLLDYYLINYKTRNRRPKSYLGKYLYIFNSILFVFKLSQKEKPDIYLSFASFFTAFVAFLRRKPHIAFDDTDHNIMNHGLYLPFTDLVITPCSFTKKFGKKQILFRGFMELCYLHPNRFKKDTKIFNLLKIKKNENYVILRFISWQASHDLGQNGISNINKIELVKEISKYAKVFISAEGPLPIELESLRIQLSPENFHDLLAFATLVVGEGGTTATECAMLGIPNVLINPLAKFVGNHLALQNRYQLQYFFNDIESAHEKIIEILNSKKIRNQFELNRDKMLSDSIDVTSFMVWLVENFPGSVKIIKENADYQLNFK